MHKTAENNKTQKEKGKMAQRNEMNLKTNPKKNKDLRIARQIQNNHFKEVQCTTREELNKQN